MIYCVQSLKKVKHTGESARVAVAAGIGLIVIACAAFVGAFVMHLVGRPLGWSVLAVVGGMAALGLAGVTFIADLADRCAKQLQHKEEH
jgi:hypothetical protein